MNHLVIGLVLLTALAVPFLAYASWSMWPEFMDHMHMDIHDHMMGHEHCEEYEPEAMQVSLTGVVTDKNTESIEISSNDNNFIVLINDAWIVDYGNGTIDIIGSKELLDNYISVNSTVIVLGYKNMEHISEYNIILPKEIILVNKGLVAKSVEYGESNMDENEEHCPMM